MIGIREVKTTLPARAVPARPKSFWEPGNPCSEFSTRVRGGMSIFASGNSKGVSTAPAAIVIETNKARFRLVILLPQLRAGRYDTRNAHKVHSKPDADTD